MSAHGTVARYCAGCRCKPCDRANYRRQKRYRMATGAGADGKPQRPLTVDAGPVRAHIAVLVASGWTRTQIAAEVGRTVFWLHAIVDRTRSKTGRKRIRRDIADALLAIQPLAPVTVDEVVIDRLIRTPVDGYWRDLGANRDERIAAAELADRAGVPRAHIERRYSLRAGRDFAVREEQAS